MAPKKKGVTIPTLQNGFGVEEGAEITIVLPEWGRLSLIAGGIMEVALHGSSLGVGTEEWFAMSIDSVKGTAATGFCVAGTLMGCGAENLMGEVASILEDGAVHLCPMDPCGETLHAIHATRIRLWKPSSFDAAYLSGEGQRLLKRLQETERKEAAALSGPTQPRKRPAASRGGTAPARRRKRAPEDTETGAIPVTSGEEEEGDTEDVDDPSAGASRAGLRELLKKTKERILGGNRPVRKTGAEEDVSGGRPPGRTRPAAGRSGPVSGTALKPGKTTPFGLMPLEDTNEDGTPLLKKKRRSSAGAATSLLAQAVQASAADAQARKEKKRAKDKENPIKQLVALLKGKSKKKKSKKDGKSRKTRQRAKALTALKPDPGDPDPDDSSSSTGETSSGEEGERSEAESDLSFEPPLRKKALRDPGSVMEMLVRHAQQQLDRGSLMDTEAEGGALTSGVKIATYFALLIRPYHQPGSPLLRELYSLAQSIDLLRAGRLPETADALASRFVAVHTALTDGGWGTASQLELHPLEPVQSASTATMLEAQKHRRLVLKSQGLGTTSWWSASGKGKGGFPYREKGKKGDGKVKGRGKGRRSGKDAGWSGSKGENNPWRENKEDAPKK